MATLFYAPLYFQASEGVAGQRRRTPSAAVHPGGCFGRSLRRVRDEENREILLACRVVFGFSCMTVGVDVDIPQIWRGSISLIIIAGTALCGFGNGLGGDSKPDWTGYIYIPPSLESILKYP